MLHESGKRGAWIVKVGERGQIVIPKEAREMFGIQPGGSVLLVGDIKRGLAVLSGDAMDHVAQRLWDGRMLATEEDGDGSD